MHFFSIYFSVSRRCGPWISNWSCLCIITFASDGRCSSCRITEDTDSSFALSHCIYLGCGHSHSFTCCQVRGLNSTQGAGRASDPPQKLNNNMIIVFGYL